MSEAMKKRDAIKVLLVEDPIDDAELLLAEMRRRGLPVVSQRVESAPAYTDALRQFAPQLILSDYTLPDFDGPLALRIARRERPDTPFIFVSGTIGEERAIDALQQGAVDYVLKDNRARLVPAIERALKEADDREARRLALRQLEASEERFRSISEATREWIWEMDSRGVYTFSSPAVETMIGYKPQEVLGKNFLDLVSATLRPQLAQLLRRGVVERTGWRDVVLHLQHTVGGVRWLDQSALPLLNDAGNVIGYRGVTRDITQRRTQQDRIARLSRIQAVLSGINSTIVRVRERRELFREACRIAVQQGGFRMAWVGLVERGAASATPLVWEGFDHGYLAAVTSAVGGEGGDAGAVGAAIREKTMIVANDIEADPHFVFKRDALARGYRSMIAMPLLVADEAVGVLVLYAEEAGFFDREELKLLKDLAGDISFALDYIGKEERLAYVSYYDTLTGLPNRQLFFDRLAQALNAARAEGRELAVMIIDVQGFKRVNDTLGRHAGDRVLKELGLRLERTTAESAAPARIGGDRFAVVVPNLSAANVARWIDEWLVDSFAEPLTVDGVELRTSVKVGIALFPTDADTAETLFVNAEAALQRAIGAADPYLFYSPEMNARIAERLYLESRLRKALHERQFVLHYQTKVDLATRQILGLEALIRWNDPEKGLGLPGDFVPLLEESGLIVEVGRWVIEQAAADIQSWRDLGLRSPRVAVNVSEVQVRHPHFVATVLRAVDYPNALDAGIDLEITETMVAQDAGTNVQKLSQLRAAGMRVFLDDFGTGYSGLSQLARLPIDGLKIDRAFIAEMTTSSEHTAIVSTIINLAKALRMFVVAEGVETAEQAVRLQALGCDEAQGYLFSHPLPAGQTAQLLAQPLAVPAPR
jgi:diguanylate cyclase (GGDEF)-like protein/PAS domain S-box-containing protein